MQFPDRKEGIFRPGKELKGLRGGILRYVAQAITQIDTARADNPVSPDWTARAARQGEANGRIKSTLSGWKLVSFHPET
jgi:hypothetical protein